MWLNKFNQRWKEDRANIFKKYILKTIHIKLYERDEKDTYQDSIMNALIRNKYHYNRCAQKCSATFACYSSMMYTPAHNKVIWIRWPDETPGALVYIGAASIHHTHKQPVIFEVMIDGSYRTHIIIL